MKPLFFKRNLILCLLLTACAGGGFDVQPVTVVNPPPAGSQVAKPKDVATPPKPVSPEAQGLMKPALGYSMPIPRRNQSIFDSTGKQLPNGAQVQEHLPLNPADARALHPTDIVTPPHGDELAARQPGVRVFSSTPDQRGYQFVHAGYTYTDFLDSKQKYDRQKGINIEGNDGYIFYQGRNPSQALPVSQSVRYKGHWDFVTDAKHHRTILKHGDTTEIIGGGEQLGFSRGNGNQVGAISPEEIGTAVSDDRKLGWRARQHVSEFEADFANKTLTGKLLYRPEKVRRDDPVADLKTRYTINAKIQNNRFSGTATATDKNNPDNHFFRGDSTLLEGGFFGGRGEELAGKFLANDNSLFGVFAAKQENPADAEKIVDAYEINVSGTDPVISRPMPNFGDASKLLVDGETISLLPENGKFVSTREVNLASGRTVNISVCCDNLSYAKFGSISKSQLDGEEAVGGNDDDEYYDDYEGYDDEGESVDGSDNTDGHDGENGDTADNGDNGENSDTDTAANTPPAPPVIDDHTADSAAFTGAPYGKFLFIQGERTRSAAIPDRGRAQYRGTWQGFSEKNTRWSAQPGKGIMDSKAEFDVDFGTKELLGRLTEYNGVRPAFLIDAKIQGSGFAGFVKTQDDGFNLDPERIGLSGTGGEAILKMRDVPVKGGFYGPNAEELGGGFFSDEHKTGAVFGGKRQADGN